MSARSSKTECDFANSLKSVEDFQDDLIDDTNEKISECQPAGSTVQSQRSHAEADDSGFSVEEFNRQYDLTPVDPSKRRNGRRVLHTRKGNDTPSFSIDPWELTSPRKQEMEENENFARLGISMSR